MTKTINAQTFLARRFFQVGVGVLGLALCLPVSFASDTVMTDRTASAATAKREMEWHEAKAKDYELQASTHRAALVALWAKFARERRKIAVLPKMVGENPYVKKLRVETERAEAKLISLASEAEASAHYHRMRAREWAAEEERIAANR